jgi:hypothetical protein
MFENQTFDKIPLLGYNFFIILYLALLTMNFNTGNNKKEHTPSSQSNTQENPIQKSLGEILLDDSFHENEEISALDDAIKDSSTDLRNIVDTYDEDLRILEHKRFSIRKPINLYRIEEKIDHLK